MRHSEGVPLIASEPSSSPTRPDPGARMLGIDLARAVALLGMMATHTIKDPDLAFHCGMIAHHAGAIAMAEVELKYGDDEESKAMAQKIIDAQGPEIEEMTAWVEENAGQQ